MGGVIRAEGILGAGTQKLVRLHCERGNIQEMVELIAEGMLAKAMLDRRIPQNAGEKTSDLLARAEEAIIREVDDYTMRGGVLTSKYVPKSGLVAESAKQWLAGFSSIAHTAEKDLGAGLSDPEIQDRLTLVALTLKKILEDKTEPAQVNASLDPEYHTRVLKVADIEGICKRAAVAMLRAFNNPNSANHTIIHGDDK